MGQRSVKGFTPPKGRPEWTVYPYGDADSCWGCGLSAEITLNVCPTPQHYCVYCDDLRKELLDSRGTEASRYDPQIVSKTWR